MHFLAFERENYCLICHQTVIVTKRMSSVTGVVILIA